MLESTIYHPPSRMFDIRDMLEMGWRNADRDAEERQLGMRVVPAVKLADRLRVHVARLGLHEHAFIMKIRFEDPLQRDEERRPVVAMPVRVAKRRDLAVVNQHLGLWILRQVSVHRVEQHVAIQLASWTDVSAELQ